MKPDEHLCCMAATYSDRNKEYGDAYKRHGEVMAALFPNPIALENATDHNRFALLTMVVGKLVRYSSNFIAGGHEDSLHDMAVYAAMLSEMDGIAKDSADVLYVSAKEVSSFPLMIPIVKHNGQFLVTLPQPGGLPDMNYSGHSIPDLISLLVGDGYEVSTKPKRIK